MVHSLINMVIIIAIIIYYLITIVLLITDNRESSATLAWLLVIIFVPIIGLLIYIVMGRNQRTLTKKKQQIQKLLEEYMAQTLSPLVRKEKERAEQVKNNWTLAYKKELIELLYRSSNSLLTTNNSVKILQSGEDKFKSLFEDIKNAKKFIHLEYYIIRSDKLGDKLKDILIEKAKQGVEVRIVYDAFGGFFIRGSFLRQLRKAGITALPYFNFLRPLKFHTVNYRNHRKIAIIDGNIGYSGGINIGQEYIDGGGRFASWRDTHIRIEGNAAVVLQAIFASTWYTATGEKLLDKKYYPIVESGAGNTPIQITTSGPDSEWDSIRQLYFMLITSTEKQVLIQSPYFVPDQSLRMALKTTALSGLDVKVMMTGIPDKLLPFWAAQTYFPELLKAGVRIYQYKKGFLHSKTITVDQEICSVGTANMDIRSFNLNYEVNTIIYDKKIASQLHDDFMQDLKHCKEITLKDCKTLNPFVKFRNSLARILTSLL